MLIQCTKKLLDQISAVQKHSMPYRENRMPTDDFYTWQANLVLLDRRKTIVLMHNQSRYPVVLFRIKKRDYANLEKLIMEAIKTALRIEGFNRLLIDRYFANAGPIIYSKTSSRQMVAKLNNAVRSVGFFYHLLADETLIQKNISLAAGRDYINDLGQFITPIDTLKEEFARLSGDYPEYKGKPVLDVTMLQLNIELDLPGFKVWRRVQVPATYSFWHLHRIIQIVFDWQDYHLHSFTATKDGAENLVIHMAETEIDWLDDAEYSIVREDLVSLEEVFSESRKVIYEYDFGDSWIHNIKLEKQVKASSLEAAYLGGSGERPPEDCGGPYGYTEYKRICADASDPEHEDMLAWAESQKERSFSREQINRKLGIVPHGYRDNIWR
jgi:hypothetical protein